MGDHLKSAQLFIPLPASSGTSCLGSAVMAPVALPTTRVATAAVCQSPAHLLLLEGRPSRGCGLVGQVLGISQDALASHIVTWWSIPVILALRVGSVCREENQEMRVSSPLT